MIEENREFNNLFNTQKAENSFLANEIVEISQEKDLILKALSEAKSFLSFKEFELENKQKLEKELLESLEDTKSKNRDLEMMNSELIGKLNANKEEITNYKLKIENLNKQLKEENFRLQNEVEKYRLSVRALEEDQENSIKIRIELEKQLQDSIRKNNLYESEVHELNLKLESFCSEIYEQNLKLQNLSVKLTSLEEENDKLTTQHKIFNIKIINSDNKIQNQHDYINELLNEVKVKEDLIKD